MVKTYYQLIKPGIIGGNLISTTGGFLLASGWHFDATLLLAVLTGVALIIASGCILNNYIDRDIDALMTRTKNRILVQRPIHFGIIAIFAIITGIAGLLILSFGCNPLTAYLGFAGFIIYVLFYTLWLKRRSPLSTLVGSLSGATPPVIGYCSVTAAWDTGASCLFLIFCLWQIPHHYAIGIYRLDDYKAANIPVLTVVKGLASTLDRITYYIIAYWGACILLTLTGYTGYYYLFGTSMINMWWLLTALTRKGDDKAKARKLFIQSIWVITCNSFLMAMDNYQ